MPKQQGTLVVANNIEAQISAPLDARTVVSTYADLTAEGSFPYFYRGMIVSVASEGKAYMLTDTNPTLSTSWAEIGSAATGAYDDSSLRAMIGDTDSLYTAAHNLVGAINELQTGNVFPVVNTFTSLPNTTCGFMRADKNSDTFWCYDLNNYPYNIQDFRSFVPAGGNSFYLRSTINYTEKGLIPKTTGQETFFVDIECFLTTDGYSENPAQRSGTAHAVLNDGRTLVGRITYIPSTGRLVLQDIAITTKDSDMQKRAIGYTFDVDERFVSPNISFGYAKTPEFLPGAQVDLEFYDVENFPSDFDSENPTTWPTPVKVYTGSIIDENLTFTINGVVGRFNTQRNVIEFDMTSFPEYDSQNENGTLYLHGTMVQAIDARLLQNNGNGGNNKLYDSVGENTDGAMTQKAATDAMKNAANLPSAEWTATVSMSFTETETTATVNGQTFVKVSDKSFSKEHLDGAVFLVQDTNDTRYELTASMLTDMDSLGCNGTFINLESLGGNVVFCANEPSSDDTIPAKGTYLLESLVYSAPYVTLSYSEHLSANVMPIAFGTMELEDGVTAMPDGVVYFQIEG